MIPVLFCLSSSSGKASRTEVFQLGNDVRCTISLNKVASMSGHKDGSKSFARYRKIDEDTNRKTISLLE